MIFFLPFLPRMILEQLEQQQQQQHGLDESQSVQPVFVISCWKFSSSSTVISDNFFF